MSKAYSHQGDLPFKSGVPDHSSHTRAAVWGTGPFTNWAPAFIVSRMALLVFCLGVLALTSEHTVMGSSFNETAGSVGDSDGDGVDDALDVCPDTLLAEPTPPRLKKNRYAANAAGQFVDASGAPSGFSVVDTCGCSGAQIIAAIGLSQGPAGFGVTLPVLKAWIAALPFQVKSCDLPSGASLRSAPAHMTVDFSHAILVASINAAGLTVDGLPATAVSMADADTLIFDLPALGEGTHTVRIAAGALLDVHKKPLIDFAGQFTVDLTRPHVMASSIHDGETLSPGALACAFTFSEPMLTSHLDASAFRLHGSGLGADYSPNSFQFDATATVLTLNYSDLPEDGYTLTLLSAEGGNFSVSFSLQAGTAPVFPLEKVRSAVMAGLQAGLQPLAPSPAAGAESTATIQTQSLGSLSVDQVAAPSSGATALAAVSTSSYASFFQIEGDIVTSGGTGLHDWSEVYSDYTKTTVNASGTGAISFYNDPVPVAVPGVSATVEDTLSGGNSKDIYDISQWTYNSASPQNKANLENAIAAAYLDHNNPDPANPNHTYLYVGATRYDNSGSVALGVWFLQNPIAQSGGRFYQANFDGSPNLAVPETHVNGDLLLVANFGSGTATITSFTWNNGIPATGTSLNVDTGTAAVNSSALAVPWPYRSSASGSAANFVQVGEFFEAGVDLNKLFPSHVGAFNFSSFVVETRSSTSPNATLSDFIVGHVSTAPDVTVSVVADSSTVDSGSQVGYTITVSNVGAGDALDVSLTDNSTVGLPTTSTVLPSGAHNDIVWSFASGGNPSGAFILTGTAQGTQHLSLNPNLILTFDSAPISAHIIGTGSTRGDGKLDNRATVSASNEAAGFLSNNQADAQIQIIDSGVSTAGNQNAVEGTAQSFPMGTFISANSGTAVVDVNWGDNTTHAAFSFANTPNVSVSMPAQTHTYGEEGTYTVTETVTLGTGTKAGTFLVNVSDPDVAATAGAAITKVYDGLVVGIRNLATFQDPGGAEPNLSDPTGTHYGATIDWGDGTSTAGIITFSGTPGSKTDAFTVSAPVPYKNVGTYSPKITITHEASTSQTVIDSVIITKAPLSITADANTGTSTIDAFTKVYDGHVFTAFAARYSGFVNAETPAVLVGALSFSGAGITAVNAGGSYTVTPGGQTSDNYNITYVDGTLNITKAPLTITADAVAATSLNDAFSKVYDGHGFTAFTARYDGFVNGETPTVLAGVLAFSGAATTAISAGGPYPVTPSGQTSANYNITYASGTLNITKAHLTVIATNDAIDEGINPSGNLVLSLINGFVTGEDVSVVSGKPTLTTDATGSSIPGTYTITPTVGSLIAANYDFTTFTPGTLTEIDVAPVILISTTPINLSPRDGFTRPGSFSDPGKAVPTETWTITTSYGDNTADSVSTATTPGDISISHVYQNAGQYTVTVTIADNYRASSALAFPVNVIPLPNLELAAIPPATLIPKGTVYSTFWQTTVSGTYSINWGDPAGSQNVQTGTVTVAGSTGTFNGSHVYNHTGAFTVYVTFTDTSGNYTTKPFGLTVN